MSWLTVKMRSVFPTLFLLAAMPVHAQDEGPPEWSHYIGGPTLMGETGIVFAGVNAEASEGLADDSHTFLQLRCYNGQPIVRVFWG